MAKLIFLGTSNAIPDEKHENTHMVVIAQERRVLIDCAGSPVVRLKKTILNTLSLTDLVLTHFHPDHVSGVPSLLLSSWLLGRQDPLDIYGLGYTLERIEKTMDFYEWGNWPNFFPVHFHPTPDQEMVKVFDYQDVRVLASPVKHLVPTIGLRIEFPMAGRVVAYSCDTEPCDQVIRLAHRADILIHEATGASPGHSSAAQAGEIARLAGVSELYLIHYPTGDYDAKLLVEEARETFPGKVRLAEDFMQLDF